MRREKESVEDNDNASERFDIVDDDGSEDEEREEWDEIEVDGMGPFATFPRDCRDVERGAMASRKMKKLLDARDVRDVLGLLKQQISDFEWEIGEMAWLGGVGERKERKRSMGVMGKVWAFRRWEVMERYGTYVEELDKVEGKMNGNDASKTRN